MYCVVHFETSVAGSLSEVESSRDDRNEIGQHLMGYGTKIGCRATPKRTSDNEAAVGSHLEC